ncbi:unnamed protein product [Echinostoma caproni]|uniref:Oxidoreductase n=1 Tax=Echinostoma caproni TaxID=27848 RepID=A0A183BAD6_9TREM|nr:unnamed protein product [Echinostoma caproni]
MDERSVCSLLPGSTSHHRATIAIAGRHADPMVIELIIIHPLESLFDRIVVSGGPEHGAGSILFPPAAQSLVQDPACFGHVTRLRESWLLRNTSLQNKRHVCLIGGRHLGAVHPADRQGGKSGCDAVVYDGAFGDQRGIGSVVDERYRLHQPPGC